MRIAIATLLVLAACERPAHDEPAHDPECPAAVATAFDEHEAACWLLACTDDASEIDTCASMLAEVCGQFVVTAESRTLARGALLTMAPLACE